MQEEMTATLPCTTDTTQYTVRFHFSGKRATVVLSYAIDTMVSSFSKVIITSAITGRANVFGRESQSSWPEHSKVVGLTATIIAKKKSSSWVVHAILYMI